MTWQLQNYTRSQNLAMYESHKVSLPSKKQTVLPFPSRSHDWAQVNEKRYIVSVMLPFREVGEKHKNNT